MTTDARIRRCSACALAAVIPISLIFADWPWYRGPNSDGVAESVAGIAAWPGEGPKLLWRVPLGESFGSFAVRGNRAYIFIERGGNEVCVALDADTGRELWATTIDKTIFENEGGNGPRTTPLINGDRVYVLGTYLKLVCFAAADGKILWQRDIQAEFNGQNNTAGIKQWGNAASPLLEGDLVLAAGGGAGQSILAFHKISGEVVWKRHNEKITHATATPATIHGTRQVVFFMQSGLVSIEPKSGDVLWRYPFPWNVSTASSPVVSGDIVYCSAGYGVGAGAVRVSKNGNEWTATELWRKPGDLMMHWSTAVAKDGHLYGIYGFRQLGTGPLKCVELATGKEVWSQPNFGSGGGTILVGNQLLVQSDRGPLVLVDASPSGYRETARTQPLGGKCWTMAVFAHGRIYARNTKEGVCLDVSGK